MTVSKRKRASRKRSRLHCVEFFKFRYVDQFRSVTDLGAKM